MSLCFLQIGMEHWLYDGFQVGEPYTFTYRTYDQIMGVSVDDFSLTSQANTSKLSLMCFLIGALFNLT